MPPDFIECVLDHAHEACGLSSNEGGTEAVGVGADLQGELLDITQHVELGRFISLLGKRLGCMIRLCVHWTRN